MKDLQYMSDAYLQYRLAQLERNVEEYEKILRVQRSALIMLVYRSYIRKAKSEIHAIEAEVSYRKEQENKG